MNKQPALYWIPPGAPADSFPEINTALTQPDGLLCFGGDLTETRILTAYRHGIFPWYSDGQPILWWSPNPRCVLYPQQLRITRSLKKSLRNKGFVFRVNADFKAVIQACAKQPRADQDGTWITQDMIDAYVHLHRQGHAHSFEIYQNDSLVIVLTA